MNTVDSGIIIIFALSSLLGIWRGLTKEALGLVSWVGAGIAAYVLLPVARHFAQQYIQNPMIADVAAAFIIFVTFLIFFSLISHIISSYVKDSPLGGVDRSLGFGFGIGRAILIVCGLELAMSSFMPRSQYPDLMKSARFMIMIQHGSEKLLGILPANAQQFIMTQQLKFVHDHAKKDLDHHIQDVIENKIKDEVSSLMKGTPDPSKDSDIVKPSEKLDTRKATENLAKLQVQAPSKGKQGYDKNQRGDLERLIGTVR